MRILVTASHAPFLQGGGERHVDNLCAALRAAGHVVELVRLPFKFRPEADIERLMAYCDGFDLSAPNGQHVDRLISLQFPGYGMRHPQHVVWLMHQHRAVYELFDPREATPELRELREQILAYDRRALSGVARIFANSRRVAERLRQYNGLESTPLYHPPPDAESLRCEESWGYVFCPSRLESLKRQDLLIEAARLTTGDAKILIGGEGPQRERYERLIERHGLGDKVRMIGAFTEAERRRVSGVRRGSGVCAAGGDVRGEAGGDVQRLRRSAGVRRARRDRRSGRAVPRGTGRRDRRAGCAP
jgi:glycosyltransferase involved in cell wall biosynthesis